MSQPPNYQPPRGTPYPFYHQPQLNYPSANTQQFYPNSQFTQSMMQPFQPQPPATQQLQPMYQAQSQALQPQQTSHYQTQPQQFPPHPPQPIQMVRPTPPPPPPAPKQVDPKAQLKMVYDKLTLQEVPECPQMQIMQILQRYEGIIDQMAKRKRVELQEQFIQPANKIKQTLRVLVYSEAFNQFNEVTSVDSFHPLVGKPPSMDVNDQRPSVRTRPSQTFQLILQECGNTLGQESVPSEQQHPGTHQPGFQWARQANQETSGFEIKREGQETTQVEILLQPLSHPQKYKLNKNLAQLLGIKEGTRSQILSTFWEYIKLNNLQDKDNREYIVADEQLKQIFHQERIPLGHLNMYIKMLLENQEPIRITHTITASDTPSSSLRGYDILVETDVAYQPELMPFLASKVVTDDNTDKKSTRTEHPFMILNQKVKTYEKQIQKLSEQLQSHRAKHAAYKAYAHNPSLFLETLLMQQNSYLEIMNQDNTWKSENPKNLKFLLKNQDIVEKQIRRYLEHKEENPLSSSMNN